MSIIVFDEIEKAHPQVIQALLKAMEEDYITLKNGKQIFLGHSIIVFTSNVWEKAAAQTSNIVWFSVKDTDNQEKKQKIKDDYFTKTFSPEFLGRLDEIVTFDPLTEDGLANTIKKYQQDLLYEVLLSTKWKVLIEYDETIKDYIVGKADMSKGMRNIEKLWNRELRTAVWTILKLQHLDKGYQKYILQIELVDNTLKFYLSEQAHEWLLIMNNNHLIPLDNYKKNMALVKNPDVVDYTDAKKKTLPPIIDLLWALQESKKKKDDDKNDSDEKNKK